MRDLPSGTVTFLFTDIEGSTSLLHELGPERYAEALAGHRRVLRSAFARHGGIEVDTQGDAFFVAFADAARALAAAEETQAELEHGPIRVRMGVHTGEPFLAEEGYVGVDVHRAARICAAGHGGQVVVSDATRRVVTAELRPLGSHRLKDLAESQPLWQVGDREFPPLKSLNQTNLPLQPTAFLGRERELAEVVALLGRGDARLVTLTGAGGSGKTRLAVQAAAELVDRFPDGVWWVPLQAVREPELVLPTVASTLGATGDLDEHLAGKRLLLVLDNFEQVVPAAEGLGLLLARVPALRVLATSREPLRLAGEHEQAVPPFAPTEGVGFFLARARQVRPDVASGAAVEEICRRLDHLPLALELAAARVRVLQPEQLLARLERRLPLLTGGSREAPERQRTLRATIAWSHELLTEPEQTIFARLAVFAGGFTLEAAESVSGTDVETLQGLVEKSLVRVEGDRFAMLETVREFALEQLDAAGDAEERRRLHAAWALSLAALGWNPYYGYASVDWLDRIEADLDNLRAAFAWLAEHGTDEQLGRLCVTVYVYWFLRGGMPEARRWLDVVLPRPGLSEETRGLVLTASFNTWMRLGDFEQARAAADEKLARAGADPLRIVSALRDAGIVATALGTHDRAAELLDEAMLLARRHAYPDLAVVAFQRAQVEETRGNWSRSAELADEAVAIAEERGDVGIAVRAAYALALALVMLGRVDEAKPRLDEVLRAALVRRRSLVPYVLETLARLLACETRYADAARLLAAAETLRRELGDAIVAGDAERRAQTDERVRTALGARAYAEAIAAGATLSAEAAAEIALGDMAPSSPRPADVASPR